jgi:hypothetical protein
VRCSTRVWRRVRGPLHCWQARWWWSPKPPHSLHGAVDWRGSSRCWRSAKRIGPSARRRGGWVGSTQRRGRASAEPSSSSQARCSSVASPRPLMLRPLLLRPVLLRLRLLLRLLLLVACLLLKLLLLWLLLLRPLLLRHVLLRLLLRLLLLVACLLLRPLLLRPVLLRLLLRLLLLVVCLLLRPVLLRPLLRPLLLVRTVYSFANPSNPHHSSHNWEGGEARRLVGADHIRAHNRHPGAVRERRAAVRERRAAVLPAGSSGRPCSRRRW